jgi:TRAP-type C4-dicarboxylate transport system substrate-binding protein
MKRLVAVIAITSTFAIAWTAFEEIPLVVIGQPNMTGKIQSALEEPFFRQLKEKAKVNFRTEYTPVNKAGYHDTHELQILKQGKADIVSLRFPQNSHDEPSLQAIDLASFVSDFAEAKEVAAAYSDVIDKNLQKNFRAKLLGIWSFGPQELFCTDPIRRLQDIRGRRVGTSSKQMSLFVAELGGKPAVIEFSETLGALRDGMVGCAITSGASANSAGWPKYAKYNYPFPIQFGLNGYAITLAKWNSLSHHQQARLREAFNTHIRDIWHYSEFLYVDTGKCYIGMRCRSGPQYKGTISTIDPKDDTLASNILKERIIPVFKAECQVIRASCQREWDERLRRILLLSIEKNRRINKGI